MLLCWRSLLPIWLPLQVPCSHIVLVLPFPWPCPPPACIKRSLGTGSLEALFWPCRPAHRKSNEFPKGMGKTMASCWHSSSSQISGAINTHWPGSPVASQQKEVGAWLIAPHLCLPGPARQLTSIWAQPSTICYPQYDAQVDETGIHALSCCKSKRRLLGDS